MGYILKYHTYPWDKVEEQTEKDAIFSEMEKQDE